VSFRERYARDTGRNIDDAEEKCESTACCWRGGSGALPELRLPPWRAMHEYKFLQTIYEDGRPTDCVPFINRFPPFALQCPESRFLRPLEFVPLFFSD